MNISFKSFVFIVITGISLNSCMHSPGNSWSSAVPVETSYIIIPSRKATVQSVLHSKYFPFLEDISTPGFQLIAKIDSTASSSMPVRSILLYPGNNQQFQPIWVTRSPDDFRDKLRDKYARKFAQNEYHFHDVTILNLQFGERHIFVARLSDFLLMSESSLGIENAIRAYQGIEPAADLADIPIMPASVIMNTPSLDRWISQLARVKYQPTINNAFKGTYPGVLTVQQQGDSTKKQYHLSGTISLKDNSKTELINTISQQNGPVTLDSYISSNAAGFGIFHARAPQNMPSSTPDTTDADAWLMNHSDAYHDLAGTLDPEFGLVMFAESGFLSTGEYLYLRKLKDVQAFRNRLETMNQNNQIKKFDDVYFVQSYGLAQLLGSRLCNFKDFYIKIIGDVAAIARRKGLVEHVASDRDRRQTVSYETYYDEIGKRFPKKLSALFVTGPEFKTFLTPFLTGNHYINALTSSFNYMALTTQINESGNSLSINLSTFNNDNGNRAYHENWIYKTRGAELSGQPVFGNIGGGFNDEVVFATKTGNIYALAADGTIIQQYNTGSDVPVGSPVVYDWYGTGQNVILIAAGDKIYGWDKNGDLLPQFPFKLNETITTPLTVADLNNNKLPNAIVGTANRKMHVLNGRGNDLAGWPVMTNAAVTTAPLVGYFEGISSVIAFASNAVHAWNAEGDALPGFPQFINAEFRGSPAKFNDTIFGNAVDGKLYAIGDKIPFSDSLNVYNSSTSGARIKAINVSNSPLMGTPFVDEKNILITSSNGSVFLLNAAGQLQLTKNMGQTGAKNESSMILDINGDGNEDIVSLAGYGRLYGWQIKDGKRIVGLPKAGMSHINIEDLDGDGLEELVAQTDDGVQCWTINRQH